MGDLPFIKFFYGDWLKDTVMLEAETRGFWLDMILYMHNQGHTGVFEGTWKEAAKAGRCDLEQTKRAVEELQKYEVADVENLTVRSMSDECQVDVRIINRRMVREEKERETNRLHKQASRKRKKKPDGQVDVREMSPRARAGDLQSPESRVQSPDPLPDSRDQKEKPLSGKPSVKVNPELESKIDQVIEYLNSKTGAEFDLNLALYRRPIRARLRDGKMSVKDLCLVVDFKHVDEYLLGKGLVRPQTLFGTKCDSYLQAARQAPPVKISKMMQNFKTFVESGDDDQRGVRPDDRPDDGFVSDDPFP